MSLWKLILQAQVLCQRVLGSSLTVPRVALFWTEISDVVPGTCGSHSPRLWVTVPSAPITTGTTLAFTLHILCSSSFSPWCFLKLLVFLLPDVAVARGRYVCHRCFLLLLVNQQNAVTWLSVWIQKSRRILAWSLSTTLTGWLPARTQCRCFWTL